jgi:hypothetical protein
MFGVLSPLDDKFGFLDVSQSFKRANTKSIEDFWVRTVNMEGMNFILVFLIFSRKKRCSSSLIII